MQPVKKQNIKRKKHWFRLESPSFAFGANFAPISNVATSPVRQRLDLSENVRRHTLKTINRLLGTSPSTSMMPNAFFNYHYNLIRWPISVFIFQIKFHALSPCLTFENGMHFFALFFSSSMNTRSPFSLVVASISWEFSAFNHDILNIVQHVEIHFSVEEQEKKSFFSVHFPLHKMLQQTTNETFDEFCSGAWFICSLKSSI